MEVNSPWGKDDTVGEAARPQGDVRRIIITNGRQRLNVFWRMVAQPLWDNPSTDRVTGIDFAIDWQGTGPALDREVVFLREDNVWKAAIFNARGVLVCSRSAGGVRVQPGFRFNSNAPTDCLGGDTSVSDPEINDMPNSRFYGPFIRIPQQESAGRAAGLDGWTRH